MKCIDRGDEARHEGISRDRRRAFAPLLHRQKFFDDVNCLSNKHFIINKHIRCIDGILSRSEKG